MLPFPLASPEPGSAADNDSESATDASDRDGRRRELQTRALYTLDDLARFSQGMLYITSNCNIVLYYSSIILLYSILS